VTDTGWATGQSQAVSSASRCTTRPARIGAGAAISPLGSGRASRLLNPISGSLR
jgi:hypothetical protein